MKYSCVIGHRQKRRRNRALTIPAAGGLRPLATGIWGYNPVKAGREVTLVMLDGVVSLEGIGTARLLQCLRQFHFARPGSSNSRSRVGGCVKQAAYRGTSRMINCHPLGPYRRLVPWVLGES